MIFALVCLAAAAVASPPLTTIQDVLYKADGTRFNGTLTISWNSFQAADNSAIVTQTSTVKVVEGNLRVQLVPNTTATPLVYYTVTYNSDGRVQFQENWAVPSSTTPLRVRDVRVATPVIAAGTGGAGNDTGGGPVPESDVVGLIADLGARPVKSSSLGAGTVAFVDALGLLDSVIGNASDCVHVDGSSGPCGSGGATSFVDGDSLTGIVDGSNGSFALSGTPAPATSLALYRNGILLKAGQDFSVSGSAITFVAAAVPQPGDTLLASYRLGTSDSGAAQMFPAPQVLCSGTGLAITATTLSSIGTCAIPAGLLLPGDRVTIAFDLSHQGSTSGFSFEVDWGSTAIVARSGASTDTLITGRADAAILAAGSQVSTQSWGAILPFNATVAAASDAYANGITINLQGMLAQSGDTLSLASYTVVRLP
ncbi:MAG: hypothetical protein ABSF62_02175 [Bryobacteraceae bacterium]